MKKEADKVFAVPEALKNAVIDGRLIQGQLTSAMNAETGAEETALQYWLKPHLIPDFGVNAKQLQAEHMVVNSIIMESNDDLGTVFHSLDKGMIYLFAIQGIDNAKLVRSGEKFSLEDVENTVLDVEDALQMAGDAYCLRCSIETGNWDVAAAYEMLGAYANIMGFGECRLDGNVLSLPELVEQDEYDEDDAEDDAEIDAAEPDVEIFINDDKTITLSYCDDDGNEIHEKFPFHQGGLMSMFLELWELGRKRGLNREDDLPMFTHLFDVMDDRDTGELIRDIVLVKQDNPQYTKAMQAFLEMGTPLIRDLH